MSEGLCIPHFYTLLHLSAQFSGLGCAKMYILHPWSEWVEKEAKPGQFFRGSPWSKLLSQAYVSLALSFGAYRTLFRTPLLPPKGAVGPIGLTLGKIAESWSYTDLRIATQNTTCLIHSVQTRKIIHRAFDSSHLFSNSSVILLDRSFSSSDACLTDN